MQKIVGAPCAAEKLLLALLGSELRLPNSKARRLRGARRRLPTSVGAASPNARRLSIGTTGWLFDAVTILKKARVHSKPYILWR